MLQNLYKKIICGFSDIFALPIENVLLVPDYTMEEIGR